MDDITLVAKIDDRTTLYASPVHDQTYREHVENDNLGGATGYFIAREHDKSYEILAKVVSLDAAREIFSMLAAKSKSA